MKKLFPFVCCCVLLLSCAQQVTPVTNPKSAGLPSITINAFEDGGSVQANNLHGGAIVNGDYGMAVTFSGSAFSSGGVLDFSIVVRKNASVVFRASISSSVNAAGKVPNNLAILGTDNSGGNGNTPMKLVLDAEIEVTVTAHNYAGKSNSFVLTYIPVAAEQRHKQLTETVTLTKNNQLNIFSAKFPFFRANARLFAINGGPADVYLLKPAGGQPFKCTDPAATVRLPAFGNLMPNDYNSLFGSLQPRLPLTFNACALGPAGNQQQVTVQVSYIID